MSISFDVSVAQGDLVGFREGGGYRQLAATSPRATARAATLPTTKIREWTVGNAG